MHRVTRETPERERSAGEGGVPHRRVGRDKAEPEIDALELPTLLVEPRQEHECGRDTRLGPELRGAVPVVVHEAAGTTRDSIATPLTWRGESLQLADTAGIRKRSAGGASREELDVMSVYKARETVRRAHVALGA